MRFAMHVRLVAKRTELLTDFGVFRRVSRFKVSGKWMEIFPSVQQCVESPMDGWIIGFFSGFCVALKFKNSREKLRRKKGRKMPSSRSSYVTENAHFRRNRGNGGIFMFP